MPHPFRLPTLPRISSAVALLPLALAASPVAMLRAQAVPSCTAAPLVVCTPRLEAAVAEFRITQSVGTYSAVMQVRLANRGTSPLVLGYVDGSGQLVDDQGNRWTVMGSQAVRGIGRVGNSIDASFELQPGEAGDASFELRYMGGAGSIRGTRFTSSLAVREIEKLGSGQVRLGREHVLRFTGLGDGVRAASAAGAAAAGDQAAGTAESAPVAAPTGTGSNTGAITATSAAEAACTGRSRCQSAGPLVAEIIRVVGTGAAGRGHSLQVGVRFRNLSARPVTIGYRAASVRASDENGEPYRRDGAAEVRGIGVIGRSGADPQFVLAPGAAREAVFGVTRYWKVGTALGTRFAFDIAVAELDVLPGKQVSVGREYALAWTDLTLGGAGAADMQKGVDALKSIFKKKKGTD